MDDDEPAGYGTAEDEPAGYGTTEDEEGDRTARLAMVAGWALGLAIVLLRGLDLFWYLFLSAYVVGLLYARHLRTIGDPEGRTAMGWALLIPPLAWWTFLLHWLEHRGRPLDQPDEATAGDPPPS